MAHKTTMEMPRLYLEIGVVTMMDFEIVYLVITLTEGFLVHYTFLSWAGV